MSLRLVFACSLSVFALPAQESPAEAVLRQVAQTYREIRTESIEATLVLVANANAMRIEVPMTGARRGPGEVRIEARNPMMATQTVSDGKQVWKYVDQFQQYTKKPATAGMDSITKGLGQILAGEKVMDGLVKATLLRREKLSVAGKDIECEVVEAVYAKTEDGQPRQEESKTYWVDRSRGVILKMSFPLMVPSSGGRLEMTQTIAVNSIRLDQPLSDALFVFTPPAGAREVAEFTPVAAKPAIPQREK
jgi:outer membrane lipoprotein-sorting protein